MYREASVGLDTSLSSGAHPSIEIYSYDNSNDKTSNFRRYFQANQDEQILDYSSAYSQYSNTNDLLSNYHRSPDEASRVVQYPVDIYPKSSSDDIRTSYPKPEIESQSRSDRLGNLMDYDSRSSYQSYSRRSPISRIDNRRSLIVSNSEHMPKKKLRKHSPVPEMRGYQSYAHRRSPELRLDYRKMDDYRTSRNERPFDRNTRRDSRERTWLKPPARYEHNSDSYSQTENISSLLDSNSLRTHQDSISLRESEIYTRENSHGVSNSSSRLTEAERNLRYSLTETERSLRYSLTSSSRYTSSIPSGLTQAERSLRFRSNTLSKTKYVRGRTEVNTPSYKQKGKLQAPKPKNKVLAILGEDADDLAQHSQSNESVTTSVLAEYIPMEVQGSPTPEETITSHTERDLLSIPKGAEDHRHSIAERETDRETDGDAAVKRRRLPKRGRKVLRRLLGEGVEYETALAKVLRDLNIPAATPEEGGPSTSKTTSKRLRSDDNCSSGAEAKKLRGEGIGLMSFSAVVEGIRVGIIHSEYPTQLIDNEHLELLQKAIMEAVEKIPEKVDRQIRFLGCTHQPGWLVLTCADQESRNWLKATVETLEPWEGAALRIVEGAEMPKPHVCVAYIPDLVGGKRTSPESVLNRLRRANRNLLTQEWKILSCDESGSGHTWTFSMDEGSVRALEQLDFKPYFNFGRVQFRLKALKAEGSGKFTHRPKPSNPGDEIGPSTSGVKRASSGTTTSVDKESGRVPNQGGNTMDV
ncbi:hypothetical protein JTB14_027638 [Gonioctena quinquepunctata]|nr:hypothetical protein JTB14_027638 [Gonioctena quinquepunctata]